MTFSSFHALKTPLPLSISTAVHFCVCALTSFKCPTFEAWNVASEKGKHSSSSSRRKSQELPQQQHPEQRAVCLPNGMGCQNKNHQQSDRCEMCRRSGGPHILPGGEACARIATSRRANGWKYVGKPSERSGSGRIVFLQFSRSHARFRLGVFQRAFLLCARFFVPKERESFFFLVENGCLFAFHMVRVIFVHVHCSRHTYSASLEGAEVVWCWGMARRPVRPEMERIEPGLGWRGDEGCWRWVGLIRKTVV